MVEAVNNCIENIEQSAHLNIYITVYKEEAIESARMLDNKIANNEQLGALAGCIVSVKDNIVQKGKKVTAGSKILEGYVSPYDATAIARLLAEDAIIIGSTNCDEFGMGSSNENSIYGPTINGIGENLIPGGSSGAAAVSVQQGTCHVALGSDTGGSVRQPASFCGVMGLKPSYGRVSRYGLIAYWSSFDQIGIIGKTSDDIASVLEVISGVDEMDATSSSSSKEKASIQQNTSFCFFPSMIHHDGLDEAIKSNFLETVENLKRLGAIIKEHSFELGDYLVPTYYVLTTAEASTNLSRYDGVRFGYRSETSETLEEMYVNTCTGGFGKEVKRRIALGTFVLSEGYFDAYFTKAQKMRRLIKEEIDQLFEKHDFIILPTSTVLPWKIGAMNDDPIAIYLSDMYTVLANLLGYPAISIPSGNNSNNIPFGIQIISKKHKEYDLLSIAKLVTKI